MEWMINFLCALVLTTLTGSVLMVVWYFIGKRLDEMGHINILYHILRLNTVFFCAPVAYLVLTWMDRSNNIFGGQLFLRTPELLKLAQGVFWFWLVGAVLVLAWTIGLCIHLHGRCKRALPCHQGVLSLLEGVCRELGVRDNRVQVLRSYQTEAPYIIGVLAPKIVLPMEVYSEEELRIIFIHELIHDQQRDLWMKWASMLILCAQWFNPLVWWHHRVVKRWSEYACDFEAYQKVGSAKAYLTVMSRISVESGRRTHALTAAWYENQPELVTRIERVARYQKQEKGKKGKALMICAVMLWLNMAAVGFVSAETALAYGEIYAQTELVEIENQKSFPALEGIFLSEYELDKTVLGKTEQGIRNRMNAVAWAVPAHALQYTDFFRGIVGSEIEIHVLVHPKEAKIRVGVLMPDGTKFCVEGNDSLNHIFEIERGVGYQFFVENLNDCGVEVVGIYAIR